MHRLNLIDSFFLYADAPHAGMHGAFLQVYAPRVAESPSSRFRRIVRHIESKLDASPLFRRRIRRAPYDLDRAAWIDGGPVDLDHHIRHVQLTPPGNDVQLAAEYARIHAVAMDTTRPLWEIHVIDGLDAVSGAPSGSFALVAKFHHAGADGVSATDIVSALHSESPARTGRTRPRRAARHVLEEPAPGIVASALNSALATTRLGASLAARIPAVTRALVQQLRHRPTAGPTTNLIAPRSLLNTQISAERTYTRCSFGLGEIKRMCRHVPGATVNDAYLAICGGALRAFLQARDALPSETLLAAVPINVRVESERGEAGNQFSVMRVPLLTDEPSMKRRFERIAELTKQTKTAMGGASGARQSIAWLNELPGPLLAIAGALVREGRLAARLPPVVNLIVTNVPGPRRPLYLDGDELLEISGAPPIMDGLGLIIGAISYGRVLTVAVAACRRIMPDPRLMHGALNQAFAELRAATAVPRVRRRKHRVGPTPAAKLARLQTASSAQMDSPATAGTAPPAPNSSSSAAGP